MVKSAASSFMLRLSNPRSMRLEVCDSSEVDSSRPITLHIDRSTTEATSAMASSVMDGMDERRMELRRRDILRLGDGESVSGEDNNDWRLVDLTLLLPSNKV